MDNVVMMIRNRLNAHVIDGPDKRVANPMLKRTADLGPSQLAWCRAKWPIFETCERQAQDARAHTDRSREVAK